MHFQPMAVGFEPRPDIGVFVVGGVVLNQDRSLATVSPSQLFEETEIRSGIEDGVLAIIEPRAPEFDGTENLHVLAFSVTGTSGGQPTRLQVAWSVESCRKLASSVKISAQCR